MTERAVAADTPTPTRTPNPSRTPGRTPRGVKPRHVTRTPTPPPSQTLTGNWGGDHVGLAIGRGGATLTYDCAHGTIDQLFVVDGYGRFDLRGTHTPENTTPPVLHPARYTGTTNGLTMTLEVTMTDTGKSAGSFALTAGAPPRLTRCR
jgi:hypothetical protein